MKATCYMDSGHGRQKSQDRVLIFDSILAKGNFTAEWNNLQEGCIAIFDGVGGISGGEYASGYAASQMWNYPQQNGIQMLNPYLQGISATLRSHNGCATTASGLVIVQDHFYLFHVGNTRIWKYSGTYLEQITTDQTFIEEANHPLSQTEIEKYGSIITGCLGGNTPMNSARIYIDDITDQISGCESIMFTCDGIHDYVDSYDIEQIIRNGSSLGEVVRKARENGSEDDCSILLLQK